MKFVIILSILSAFCLLHVESDYLSEFETEVDEAVHKIIGYDGQFYNSIIVMLSNLRDATSEIAFYGWHATTELNDALNDNVIAAEKKECIASGRTEWSEELNKINSNLYMCGYNYRNNGGSIRKKFQGAYEASLEIQRELKEVKKNCSTETEKLEETCISLKVNRLEESLNNLLEQVRFFNIEAGTIKPKILSESLYCHAKVLANLNQMASNFQKKLQNCVL